MKQCRKVLVQPWKPTIYHVSPPGSLSRTVLPSQPSASPCYSSWLQRACSSSVTDVPVYQIASDVKGFFYQNYLAPEECFKVGLVTLDPRAVERHADSLRSRHPALCSVAERVREYGLLCASNIAQHTAHLLIFIWYVEMDLSAASLVEAMRRQHPAIRHWQDERARSIQPPPGTSKYLRVRFCQTRLWTASMYTDDGHQALLGPDLTVLGLRVWRKVTGDLKLTMAIVQKHGLGQQVTVQGFRSNSGLGLVFFPEDKLRRALLELQRAIDGLLTLAAYQSLLDFLRSLLFVLGMRRSATYGLYAPLADHVTHDPETPVALTPQICQQLREWQTRLVHNAGAPFSAAVGHQAGFRHPVDPEPAPAVFFLRSGASKEGARLPGLGGALGGRLVRYPWRAPLSPQELTLPIAVLEFAAYFMVVDSCVPGLPDEALLVSEVDTLASTDALASDAASSPLMQHVHLRLLSLPAFTGIVHRHSVAHVYGEGNLMADAVRRSMYEVADTLGQQLSLAITYEPASPRLCALMRELV